MNPITNRLKKCGIISINSFCGVEAFMMYTLKCPRCGRVFDLTGVNYLCRKCGMLLEYIYDYEKIDFNFKNLEDRGIWRYERIFPKIRKRVTLGEGKTPLKVAEDLAKKVGMKFLFLKDETLNPTNSFRDRAAALMVSQALDYGYNRIVCASNGNLGASIAAYCAKAHTHATIIVPKATHIGKLAQMFIYNAKVVEKGETLDDSLVFIEKIVKKEKVYNATAEHNSLTLEGQKTISFEIVEEIDVPDWVIVPMGSGGTIYSIWKGFTELKKLGILKELPRMIGVQAEGCSPIVRAFFNQKNNKHYEKEASTQALAILVRNPANSFLALKAIRESNGLAVAVSDEEIMSAEKLLARTEGLFAEPASASTIAALSKLLNEGTLGNDEQVVCLITASGLKAPYVLEAIIRRGKRIGFRKNVSVKLQILKLLDIGVSYGYEIWKALGKDITIQAVYQHLNELEEKDLIKSIWKGRRKYYQLTEKGKQVLSLLETLILLF